MQNLPEGAGMGSSGLVGQISTFAAMGTGIDVWILIAVFHFILPALLVWGITQVLRKYDMVHAGDMKIMI